MNSKKVLFVHMPTVNIQLTPPTTNEDISGLCWIRIPREPIKCFTHCRTFSTRVVRELEMRDLLLRCISCRRSKTSSGADMKAFLSSSKSSSIYFCIAFCNTSSFFGGVLLRRFEMVDIPSTC